MRRKHMDQSIATSAAECGGHSEQYLPQESVHPRARDERVCTRVTVVCTVHPECTEITRYVRMLGLA